MEAKNPTMTKIDIHGAGEWRCRGLIAFDIGTGLQRVEYWVADECLRKDRGCRLVYWMRWWLRRGNR